MCEISLATALDGIKSSLKSKREKGLAEFEQLLKQNRQNTKLQHLSDKQFQSLLEDLFKTVVQAKSQLLAGGKSSKPKTGTAREKASDLISACAHAVRITIEIAVKPIKASNTVRAILEHILGTTRGDDGEFFEPLLDNYFKALKAFLTHRPHLEHLSEETWLDLVEFCCASLRYVNKTRPNSTNQPQLVLSTRSSTRTKALSRSGTPAQNPDPSSNARSQGYSDEAAASANRRADDLVQCLDYLMSVRHIDILRKPDDVLSSIFETLGPTLKDNRHDTQQPCFSCINSILFRATTENVELAIATFTSALYYIRRSWNAKLAADLRDQMLMTLLRGQCLIPSIIKASHGDEDNYHDLVGLLDRLHLEYGDRLMDHMLQVVDIGLSLTGFDLAMNPFSTESFCISNSTSASESSWAQLYVMADLFYQLRIVPFVQLFTAQDDGAASKRTKHESPLHSLIRSVSTSQRGKQLASLQFLTFILARASLTRLDDLQMLLEILFPLISRDNGQLSSWSMLSLAIVCQQDIATAIGDQDNIWLQIFQVSITKVASARVSRFACHLADSILNRGLISFPDAADTLDGLLTSVDVSGPSGLSDTAMSFWKSVLALYGSHRATLYEPVSSNVLRWLFRVWRPSQLDLRSVEANGTTSFDISSFVDLLQLLVGEKDSFTNKSGQRRLTKLSRAKRLCDEDQALTDFLITDKAPAQQSSRTSNAAKLRRSDPQLSTRAKRAALATAFDYLISELEAFLSTQSGSVALSQLSPLNLRNSLTTCVVGLGMADVIAQSDISKSNQLLSRAIDLRDRTAQSFLHIPHSDITPMCNVLFSVLQNLRLLPLGSFESLSPFELAVVRTARAFDKEFWKQVQKRKDSNSGEDLIEILNSEESQKSTASRAPVGTVTEDFAQDWLTAYSDERAYRNTILAEMSFAGCLPDPSSISPDESKSLPQSLVDYLVSLDGPDFLACRPFLDEIYASRLEVDPHSGFQLLTFIVTKLLKSYDLQRNETTFSTCLDLLSQLVHHWAATDMVTDISDAAEQLYDYFMVAAERKALSPHVQTKMARMLQKVIKRNAAYGRSKNRPSPRTNLFRLLETGNVGVKYQISRTIAVILGFFLLKDHDAILDDIEKSIPHDPDSTEITAVRLSLLGHLASSWSTLIRRCVYSIVDATALMPAVVPYAHTCLKSLGNDLGMSDLRDLFRLFVPQILYTWLETRNVDSLPYSIFEYKTLQEMLCDVKHEVAAQTVMRGKEEVIPLITSMTGSDFRTLLSQSFGKCAAYCIARDTAVAPEADPMAAEAAKRLRLHLDRDEYSALIAARFPEIVATFFKILDREDLITKSFMKNPNHIAAQEAFEQMLAAGASQNTPPVSQQPSFRSNCLIDELEYVCQRSPYELQDLWTPPLYVFVFRSLLETVHPALGPLHAAAVVRRIRILVSMAGRVALEGYPLEMTLGSLRGHLDNTHSAEDVMGLYRYLLKVGEPYLSANISFLAGFIVSVLVSLKALMEKPQESTTQESAFQATLQRAEDFQSWITNYASSLEISTLSADAQHSFRDMVRAAANTRGYGRADKDSAEGDLLLRLLSDEVSEESLIDRVSRNEIVRLLCKDFKYSGDFRNDILSEGSTAATLATAAMKVYGLEGLGRSFNLWILRVLGRAYAAHGFIEQSFQYETIDRVEVEVMTSEGDSFVIVSASALISLLYQVACAHRANEAGFAERSVQSLLSKAISNNELKAVTSAIPPQALSAMNWDKFIPPPSMPQDFKQTNLQNALTLRADLSLEKWCTQVCQALVNASGEDIFLTDLKIAIANVSKFAVRGFPYILHLVLVRECGKQEQVKKIVSTALRQMMVDYSDSIRPFLEHMINSIIYLRSQPMPYENTRSDRAGWLDVDYRLAAEIATRCKMFKTALLFIEIALSYEGVIKGSRRSSAARVDAPTDLLLQIFQNIEEKDYYHGVRRPTSLASMMERLDMEQAGFRSLSFRGASFDIESRRGENDKTSVNALIKSLNNLELSSLSQAIAVSAEATSDLSGEVVFDAARKLEKWDIPCPDATKSPAVTLFKAFQTVQTANDRNYLTKIIDLQLDNMLHPLQGSLSSASATSSYWSTLAALVEIEELLSAKGPQQLQATWEDLEKRGEWLRSADSDQIERLLSSRETLLSVLNKTPGLQSLMKAPPKQTRMIQIRSLLESSDIYRSHGNLQKSLAAATAIEKLLPECNELGLKVEASARIEVSNVLWDNQEMASSIRILQDVSQTVDFSRQDIPISKPELLARLAGRVSEARLEQPDEILARYLEPAVKDLKGNSLGEAAGRVFHEFASFCDQQLQNSESTEDFARAQKLRDDKVDEIRELDQMIKNAQAGSKERENFKSYRAKAKQWYDLDNAEFKRLQNSRDILLKQSLENYLRCLKASDTFDRDAIRFSALWLQHCDKPVANEVVAGNIIDVNSRKFANLMNQWTSRLLDEDNQFQKLLSDLIYRICVEHPYHGMYNMFASSRSKGGKDQAAMSRHAAANIIVKRLRSSREVEARWLALHNSCVQYVRFASEKPEDGKYRAGTKVLLEKSQTGVKLQEVIHLKMPPATMKIELRRDCNYKNVPVIVKWSREFSVASGISAPKIVTATASNGMKYKELFKSGNDDLRQDAIMEQVFEQVSELLVSHRETRKRKLGIRSYKVLPLTAGSGIIEFVSNTIPINDFLVPAHAEHYPNDLKASAARKIIHDAAASRRNDHRVMEYRRVCERMHPVLRFFFMERFIKPDDWFEKRLNYTRTTAAVSMLGHILGLGDRHGHNILLDEKTGEVVHIDLGIAFEQGRILPVPELVPFRLTRDIVDGFGVTKTEGVFRRCCEFTLDALRQESYSIMTILDVLRYDPLYSWSLSPLRLKRLQEDKLNEDEDKSAINGGISGSEKPEKKENEEAEADRALTVVAKKLSKSLSVEATVNELIQQATDERNLALLFAGWAAYI